MLIPSSFDATLTYTAPTKPVATSHPLNTWNSKTSYRPCASQGIFTSAFQRLFHLYINTCLTYSKLCKVTSSSSNSQILQRRCEIYTEPISHLRYIKGHPCSYHRARSEPAIPLRVVKRRLLTLISIDLERAS
jgi:hypothetical protein